MIQSHNNQESTSIEELLIFVQRRKCDLEVLNRLRLDNDLRLIREIGQDMREEALLFGITEIESMALLLEKISPEHETWFEEIKHSMKDIVNQILIM